MTIYRVGMSLSAEAMSRAQGDELRPKSTVSLEPSMSFCAARSCQMELAGLRKEAPACAMLGDSMSCLGHLLYALAT